MKKELQIWLLGYDKDDMAVNYDHFILGREYTSQKSKKEVLENVKSFYKGYFEVNQLLKNMPEGCTYLECRIEDVEITGCGKNQVSSCVDLIDSKILNWNDERISRDE